LVDPLSGEQIELVVVHRPLLVDVGPGEVNGPWWACPADEIGSGTLTRGRDRSVGGRGRKAGVNHGGQRHETGGDGQGHHYQEASGKSFHD